MTALRPLAAVLLSAALLAGCSPRLIPGTQITDTAENRAVVAVLDQYQQAAERRDAGAVLNLVSKRYFDDAATPDPADDLDYAGLTRALPQDFARLGSVRLELRITDVRVDGEKAQAIVKFDSRYRIATRAGEVARTQSDVSRVLFVKEAGAWKIISGL